MKTFFTLLFSVSILFFLNAQDLAPVESVKLNALSIEFYQPITSNELQLLYAQDWFPNANSNSDNSTSRKRSSFAIGLSYERSFSKQINARVRLGVASENISESNKHVRSGFSSQTEITEEQFDYNQTHLNLFLGLAKRFQLLERLSCDIGLEIPIISHQRTEDEFDSVFEIKDSGQTGYQGYKYLVNRKTNYGKAFLYGIGPIAKFEYQLNRKLFISVESQLYFLHSSISSPKTVKTTNWSEAYWQPQPNVNLTETEIEINLSEWSWSNVSPLFRFGFKF